MKLISICDFVLNRYEYLKISKPPHTSLSMVAEIVKYAEFLKQPLTLGMFLPCDEEGNILNTPTSRCDLKIQLEYEQAKDRVLFSFANYTIDDIRWLLHDFDTVEELVGQEVTLTQSAIEQLGLWKQ